MKSIEIPTWSRKIEWSDFNTLKRIPESIYWERSESPPKKDEIRIISISSKNIESQFYGLFEPALSFFNGWEEHPEEIDLHRLYKAEVIEILFENEEEKWIKIKILDSKKLFEVDFIEQHTSSSLFLENYDPDYYFQYQNWRCVNFSGEGDIGYEFLFYQNKDTFKLVYQFEWFFSDDKTIIHNINCKKETIQTWLKNAKKECI